MTDRDALIRELLAIARAAERELDEATYGNECCIGEGLPPACLRFLYSADDVADLLERLHASGGAPEAEA